MVGYLIVLKLLIVSPVVVSLSQNPGFWKTYMDTGMTKNTLGVNLSSLLSAQSGYGIY